MNIIENNHIVKEVLPLFNNSIYDYIVDYLNGRLGTDNIIALFSEFFSDFYEVDEYDKLFESDPHFHFETLEKIVNLSSVDSLPTSEEDIYSNFYTNGLIYYFQLLSCLWEVGLSKLFISKTDNKVYYDSTKVVRGDPKNCLVEIYYDVLNNNIKDDYQINDVKKLEDPRYQYFIKHCLPLASNRQITINHIPLYELIQGSFERDGSLSKFQ